VPLWQKMAFFIMGLFSFFTKEHKEDLDKGLEKTKEGFFSKLTKAVAGKAKIDEEVLDRLEEALISSDVGLQTTIKIIKRIEERAAKDKFVTTGEMNKLIKEEIERILAENKNEDQENFDTPKGVKPYVIMVVGVNGVGKTTTIGKLAYQFKKAGKKVLVGAGDTFRAAAIDQLQVWATRADVEIVKSQMNADPASVAFQAVERAVAIDADVVLIDTAGRLHNRVDLMNELTKIRRVMQKVIPDAPHEVLLVLDGSTGQNAVEQAKQFTAATQVSALAITKLDGTAKGGVVLGISDQFHIPVKYIGVGEQMDKLQVFNKKLFVETLFKGE
jgi:fused signal recognition particle receptor